MGVSGESSPAPAAVGPCADGGVCLDLQDDIDHQLHVHDVHAPIGAEVARLGSFAQHELTLRPGTYTAVGSRNGYRDVRHSFTVRHDSQPAPLTIACTEPI